MFKRSFMESFKITKYARQSGKFGRVSSNSSILPRFDLKLQRFGVFFLTTFMIVNATSDFGIFYEFFIHLPQPQNKTLWEDKVPAAVKVPNEEIIEKWNQINAMKEQCRVFDA